MMLNETKQNKSRLDDFDDRTLLVATENTATKSSFVLIYAFY